MGLRLTKLTREHETALRDMLDEWRADIVARHTDGSPAAIFAADPSDFDAYVASLEPLPVPAGRVPNSVFFLLDEKSGRLLGAVDIRHELNDWLLAHGGHIGDGIRPSERGRGLGTRLVALALDECRSLGIERVLMVCSADNVASAKTIEANGGVLENEVTSDDGTLQRRFWIDL
jgi:predicted acetyltransferase